MISSSGLTQRIAENLALLEEVDDKDRAALKRMAGAVLSYVLRALSLILVSDAVKTPKQLRVGSRERASRSRSLDLSGRYS